MTTDYRALCAELLAWAEKTSSHYYKQADVLLRARAALSEQPVEPTDEELREMFNENDWNYISPETFEYIARTVLARWGNHQVSLTSSTQPLPEGNHPAKPDGSPADGEVGELVAWLKENAEDERQMSNGDNPASLNLDRAADLLQRLSPPQPVPVSERLPEPNTKVLAYYFNSHGKGRTICAIWVPAKSREVTGDDSISEPDEDYWPEGWYEQIENWEDLGWVAVYEGEVAYWQPLPKWPAHALPLPEREVSK